MKILTKEEEQEHYNETLKGGFLGGVTGLSAGLVAVYGASARYPAFRGLTLPFRTFLVVSSGTFASIVAADSFGRRFETSRHPDRAYKDEQQTLAQTLEKNKPASARALDWARENRYSLVFGSWVASMAGSLALVGRNPYLSGQQKLVQARVYAQGLTLAVVIISLAFETSDKGKGEGRWETIRVLDPDDPTHQHMIEKKIHHEKFAGEDQWMDMVAAEEERIKEREEAIKAKERRDKKEGKVKKTPKHEDGEQLKGKPTESKDKAINAP
ncbi:hypothetical protein K431DRAFT_267149 [Polychaeton citri CBS 116435]|uniref:HIG1 domain-containing protein n=1 Tax=Polychaeton citri CBS 116435 TaxID=1314669 RepID=A0A9P4UQP5_9PEZI|nr:hypothetical protein K431DRAFT_267149 [Polychaeton citri CBS 116435]